MRNKIAAGVIFIVILIGAVAMMLFSLYSVPDEDETKQTVYRSEEYGFRLLLPDNWEEKFAVAKSPYMENSLIFYDVENYRANAGGVLFTLNLYNAEAWESYQVGGAAPSRILGEYDGTVYAMFRPGDVNYDLHNEELKKQYLAMMDGFDDIAFYYLGGRKQIGYITGFDVDGGSFKFEAVNYLTLEDATTLELLVIDPDRDMPGGFYIHNPTSGIEILKINDETQYLLIDQEDTSGHKSVGLDEFLEGYVGYRVSVPFWVETDGGYVTVIKEQYLP